MIRDTIGAILKPSTIDAIRASATATCELLDPEPRTVGPVPLTTPRAVASHRCSMLKGLLLDPHFWYFAKKRCLPRDTALFRLHGEQGSLMLRRPEAATACGKGTSTWDRMTAAGLNPSPIKLGGTVLWSAEELATWVRRGCPDRATWEPVRQAIVRRGAK